jgi:uncharacterized protein YdeI (BOF family)
MLLIIILLAIVAAIAAYFLMQKSTTSTQPTQTENIQPNKQEITPKFNPSETQGENPKPALKTALEGTWVSRSDGALLEFHDNTFSIDIPSVDSHSYQKGTFSLEGTQVTFSYTDGKNPCGQGKGIYTYKISEGSLYLKFVEDNCKARRDKLVAIWDQFITK